MLVHDWIPIAEADTEVANQMAQEAGAGPLVSNALKVTIKLYL